VWQAGNAGTPVTQQQINDAYSKYSTTLGSGYNKYLDPNYLGVATTTNVDGTDRTSGGGAYDVTASMAPKSLQNMPGSTNGNLWGLQFDPNTNQFVQKLPGGTSSNAWTGGGSNNYQNYDLNGNPVGQVYNIDNSGGGMQAYLGTIAKVGAAMLGGAAAAGGNSAAPAMEVGSDAATAAAPSSSGLFGTGVSASQANQYVNVANAIANKNPVGALTSAIGPGDLSTGVNAANSAYKGDYLNAAIGGANASGQLPSDIMGMNSQDLANLAKGVTAISNNNPMGALSAGINGMNSNRVGLPTDTPNNLPVSDTQAAADALALIDGPNQNPAAYALPADIQSPDYLATFDPATVAANNAADAALNGGALTQAVSTPNSSAATLPPVEVTGKVQNPNTADPFAGLPTDSPAVPAAPGAVPLDKVTVTGTKTKPDAGALTQAITDLIPTDNPYSPAAPSDATLPPVVVTGKKPPPTTPDLGSLYGQLPAETGLPPVTPATSSVTAPPVKIPSVPVSKPATATAKTPAATSSASTAMLPGKGPMAVDMSFLNPQKVQDINALMPQAQALVDKSNGSLTLPEALKMIQSQAAQQKATA
jgi:hypothetical protein